MKNDPAVRKRALRAAMVSLGFARDRSDTQSYRYVGKLAAAGRSVSVALVFSDLEFTQLPKAILLAPEVEAPDVVAHLSVSGALCFANDADIVLDRYDVAGTAALCVELARRGLERALTRKHVASEIAAEFPQHWQGASFFYDLKDGPTANLAFLPREGDGSCPLLVSDTTALRRFVKKPSDAAEVLRSATKCHVIHVPTPLTFAEGETFPATVAMFVRWLARVAPQALGIIGRMAEHFPAVTPIFVVASNGCVGVEPDLTPAMRKGLQRREGLVRLLQRGLVAVKRFSGTRADEAFMFGRNLMSHPALLGKRIALLGCGAIGSHLASMLVHSGAGFGGGSLLLLDNQVLQPGNVGRHFLGPTRVGEFKSVALKDELGHRFPGGSFVATTTDAIACFDNLSNYDLVIDATGEEAVSIAVNEWSVGLKRSGRGPDALYVRLFGNGAAAQSLLYIGSDHACFKCLRPLLGEPARYDPMRKEQTLVQQVATCGEGAFVPYAVSAPAIAAGLALQAALEWNSGNPEYRLRTLRIDPKSTNDVSPKNPTRSERCPCCAAAPVPAKTLSAHID
jgi:molybdopterin/thiamine biosynthesis adenylyltransferase